MSSVFGLLALICGAVTVSGRWLETKQVIYRTDLLTGNVYSEWAQRKSWNDSDPIWQYGNSGLCTGPIADQPRAVVDTIWFSERNPDPEFPWYLDHIELHEGINCDDLYPLLVPMESDLTLQEMNSDLLSSSRYSSLSEIREEPAMPAQQVANMEEFFADTQIDNTIAEVLSNAESSNSDTQSAGGRLENARQVDPIGPTAIDTWELWPTFELMAPTSMRFITNRAKKHNVVAA
ncbi:hypothetical protein ABW21_db0207179 [Orbilia brochopaga]|nr:hypothetical protein ABW21_db0207179 [Drechslerella brochopaga]